MGEKNTTKLMEVLSQQSYTKRIVEKIYEDIYNPTVQLKELIGWYIYSNKLTTIGDVAIGEVDKYRKFIEDMNVCCKIAKITDSDILIIKNIPSYISHDNFSFSKDFDVFLNALELKEKFLGKQTDFDVSGILTVNKEKYLHIVSIARVLCNIDNDFYLSLYKNKEDKISETITDNTEDNDPDPVIYTLRRTNISLTRSEIKYLRDSLIEGNSKKDVAKCANVSDSTLMRIIKFYEDKYNLEHYNTLDQYKSALKEKKVQIANNARKVKEEKKKKNNDISSNSELNQSNNTEISSQSWPSIKRESRRSISVTDPEPVRQLAQKLHVSHTDILKIINKRTNKKFSNNAMINLDLTRLVCDKYNVEIKDIMPYQSLKVN